MELYRLWLRILLGNLAQVLNEESALPVFLLRANPNEWPDCSCAPSSFDSLAERSMATKRGCSVNQWPLEI